MVYTLPFGRPLGPNLFFYDQYKQSRNLARMTFILAHGQGTAAIFLSWETLFISLQIY